MACRRGKANPTQNTKLKLFADSGGYCQNPQCRIRLFASDSEKNTHFAEMAHIFAASDGGPRADIELTDAERGHYDNIILLCANCHTLIDNEPGVYDDAVVTHWKQEHTQRITGLFGVVVFETREGLRDAVDRIGTENKEVHIAIGPDNEYKHDPEAAEARAWQNAVKSTIIPNNLKLLAIFDQNSFHLTARELEIIEKFRFHVYGLISRHVSEDKFPTSRFPDEMNEILKD